MTNEIKTTDQFKLASESTTELVDTAPQFAILPPLRPHEDSMVLGFAAFKEALRDFGLIRSK